MKTYGQCVLTGVCLVAAYVLLIRGLGMMNQPSDRSLYSGLAVVLGLLMAIPRALQAIWRRRT